VTATTVLVVEHQADAGPDRLGDWLREEGVHLDVVRPYVGEAVPGRVDGGGLMVLGGSMGAADDLDHPWLPATRALLSRAVSDRVPTLGVCLGAQLLALACGGHVAVGDPGIEPGVIDVRWRPGTATDPLLAGLPDPYPGPSMHRDAVITLPPGAVWLGESDLYPHQAFAIGDAAWGLQFHPEVSVESFRSWAPENVEDFARVGTDAESVVAMLVDRDAEVVAAGRLLASRFARLVRERA
jgi:GMP synthase (glutamine-hydrolysing)